jgi:hypothetical protein
MPTGLPRLPRIIAAVGPLLLVVAGVVALAAGSLILRSFGPGYRVGRLLSATPVVSVAEALAAADGPPRYVGIRGRIDATDEFEDEHHRPLVYRRARLHARHDGDWSLVNEHVEAVDFEVREGLDAIAIDRAALDEGLVVVPRESVGTAADVPDRVPADLAPTTPVRLRIDQVSSVEHAIALGVPTAEGSSGRVRLTAGLGRPLILTTLEPPEAMRILAGGATRRPLLAAVVLAAGLVLLAIGLGWALLGAVTGVALAASPSVEPAVGGDPRSSGEGPGLVGDPLVAIVLVLAIGVGAALATLAWVRLTGGRRA